MGNVPCYKEGDGKGIPTNYLWDNGKSYGVAGGFYRDGNNVDKMRTMNGSYTTDTYSNTLFMNAASGFNFTTVESVDMTNLSKIKIKYKNAANLISTYVGVTSTKNGAVTSANGVAITNVSNVETIKEYDVSALSGNYFIGFTSGGGQIGILEWWFE